MIVYDFVVWIGLYWFGLVFSFVNLVILFGSGCLLGWCGCLVLWLYICVCGGC